MGEVCGAMRDVFGEVQADLLSVSGLARLRTFRERRRRGRLPNLVLAVHISAVMVAFGVTFAYPIVAVVGERLDRRAMPWFHRVQVAISRRLINPGLLVVLLAGIVLASDEHQWKHFYVQWASESWWSWALGGIVHDPREEAGRSRRSRSGYRLG